MWNQRFAQKEFMYGKEPNAFCKMQLKNYKLGKVLFVAEGEGRNAVYAARLGWDVFAFDASIEGIKKAQILASQSKVKIDYQLATYDEALYNKNFFDLIILIFAHHVNRSQNHQRLIKFLKPGGTIILEGFSKEQINNNTGGPPVVDLLFSKEELEADFQLLNEIKIWEERTFLNEGKGHIGESSVIRLLGKK